MKKPRGLPAVVLLLLVQGGVAEAQFLVRPLPYPPPPIPAFTYMVPVPMDNNTYRPWAYLPPPAVDTLPVPTGNRAVIHILLPSTANDLWVDGVKMRTRETASRVFISPPLESGHDYAYTIRADWPGLERMVTQERVVTVGPNRTVTVDFRRPAPTSRP